MLRSGLNEESYVESVSIFQLTFADIPDHSRPVQNLEVKTIAIPGHLHLKTNSSLFELLPPPLQIRLCMFNTTTLYFYIYHMPSVFPKCILHNVKVLQIIVRPPTPHHGQCHSIRLLVYPNFRV